MKKALLIFFALLPVSLASVGTTPEKSSHVFVDPKTSWLTIYDELGLEATGLRKDVYEYALRGLLKNSFSKSVLSIVDLSQPSSNKRLYVIDLATHKLLFHTYVAHGRNSGQLMANSFSNTNSSYKSSLGFYQTLGTYQGKHGLSLQLKGLEKGFNDNAFDRAIVMHGADYVCEDIIKQTGRLGRSQGCPAVPNALSKSIIQAIKGGSCLFIYSPYEEYLKKSSFLI
ncbi:murein L,D-transpeptidase catalytic domain family protein [Larkinella soli]|uniref:murein L,D-transpeptidase catalytic domain family protein n=1 Tax=Larkinella soli TaxID=1770527 RepID=UPI000FFCA009|nr:murein L,D-transpeptidase catalytic domain family protein [Larkinella soli]